MIRLCRSYEAAISFDEDIRAARHDVLMLMMPCAAAAPDADSADAVAAAIR